MPREPKTLQDWKDRFYELASLFEENDAQLIFALSLLKKSREELGRQYNACTNEKQKESMGNAARHTITEILTGVAEQPLPTPKSVVTIKILQDLQKDKIRRTIFRNLITEE